MDSDENASVVLSFPEIDGDCDGLHTLEWVSHDGSVVELDEALSCGLLAPTSSSVSRRCQGE